MNNPQKPNIIFYFTDQQRADTCGCYGQPLNITPNLDALAAQGIRFNNAFTPQPVCGPCRAIFQTGLYPTDTGCFRNSIALPRTVKTLANYLEEDGYKTAYVGKWHLASTGELEKKPQTDFSTTAIPPEYRGGYTGFWRAADVLEFTSHGYDGYVFDENMNKREFTGYRADCITDFALEFLDTEAAKEPFFMTISHIEPHHQNDRKHYEGPKGSKERFKNFTVPADLAGLEGDYMEEYPDYLGCCKSLDDNLGRLVQKLKDKGLYENTVIIYSSDHGSHFKTRNRDGHMTGFDDYKRSGHDGCLRVPLVISGGACPGGTVVEDLVSTVSLTKTFLALAGIDAPRLAGENLLDVAGGKIPDRDNIVFAQISESRVGRVIRTPQYKFAVYAPAKHGGLFAASDVYECDYLYDLQKDPAEHNNLINNTDYAQIKEELKKEMKKCIFNAERTEATIL